MNRGTMYRAPTFRNVVSISNIQRLNVLIEAIQAGDEGVIGRGGHDALHGGVIGLHILRVGGGVPTGDGHAADRHGG